MNTGALDSFPSPFKGLIFKYQDICAELPEACLRKLYLAQTALTAKFSPYSVSTVKNEPVSVWRAVASSLST